MKPTEGPTSPHCSDPGLETTAADSSPGRTSGRRYGRIHGQGAHGASDRRRDGPRLARHFHLSPASPNPDATAAFDRDGTAEHHPDATLGSDRNAAGNYDPDATGGFVHSPGVAAADTERDSRSAEARDEEVLPRITGYEILGVLGAAAWASCTRRGIPGSTAWSLSK